MIRHLGSSLTDVTYVFDEPTIGLHPHDIERMNDLLLQLRDKGNTVLVVEHKPETIAIADHVVDLGPGAGTAGGTVCFEGTVEGLRGSDTITGRHLDDRAALKDSVRTSSGALEVRGASTHNLQDVDVDIPLGVLCVVTGVAGSGKSSLIQGSVSGRDGVVVIDQGAIRGSRRSNPATYTGLLDPIRKAFAKANGVKPALFSSNSEGACPTCNGAGVIYTELGVMATVESTCEECEGKRFQASVLEYTLGGRNIAEVLAMSVTEAEEFFGDGEARTPAAHKILDRLADVGLGYLTLGQPLTTLSGGERQRLKLATQMAEKGDVYVLDEPTTGLHLADVEQLLGLLDRLVDSGKSVIVIEHHQAVMAHADWIIDLGPGAGHDGGRIVFEGTPADLVAARSTLTGEHLAAYGPRPSRKDDGSSAQIARGSPSSSAMTSTRSKPTSSEQSSVSVRLGRLPAPTAASHRDSANVCFSGRPQPEGPCRRRRRRARAVARTSGRRAAASGASPSARTARRRSSRRRGAPMRAAADRPGSPRTPRRRSVGHIAPRRGRARSRAPAPSARPRPSRPRSRRTPVQRSTATPAGGRSVAARRANGSVCLRGT